MPSSRRPSTPATLIHKIKTTPLKSYHTFDTHSLTETDRFGSLPPLNRRRLMKGGLVDDKSQLGEARGLEEQEKGETKEVLYTFYTKDEDLVAMGKKVYGTMAKSESTGYESYDGEEGGGARRYKHFKWDSNSGRVIRAARNTSKLFKEFLSNPVNFSRTEVAIKWMLGSYQEDTEQTATIPRRARDITPTRSGKYDRGQEGDGNFSERFGRKSWTIHPIQYGRPSDQFERQSFLRAKLRREQYNREDSLQSQLRERWDEYEKVYDGLHRRREEGGDDKWAHQDQKYLPGFEWTEIHPVVKTTSRFLIDRTPLSYLPKTLPLPPLGGATAVQGGEGNKSPPPSPPQQNVVHIRLPNMLL